MRIPKSGAKLFKYKGVTLFFRSVKGILLVYEAEHKFLICASTKTKEKTIELIVSRWEEVIGEINKRRSAEG